MAQDNQSGPSFWQTLPGALTALAGVIAAITGLLTVLYQVGVIGNKSRTDSATTVEAQTSPPTTSPATTAPAANNGSAAVPGTPAPGKAVNLLSPENGGHLVATSGDDWQATIDDKEDFNQISYGLEQQNYAVFGFRDDKPARFDGFALLVPGTQDNNTKEFELFAGNESPTGRFESIGKFTAQNIKLMQSPFQRFSFPAVTAKYLKIKLLSTYGSRHPDLREIQLFGIIEK